MPCTIRPKNSLLDQPSCVDGVGLKVAAMYGQCRCCFTKCQRNILSVVVAMISHGKQCFVMLSNQLPQCVMRCGVSSGILIVMNGLASLLVHTRCTA